MNRAYAEPSQHLLGFCVSAGPAESLKAVQSHVNIPKEVRITRQWQPVELSWMEKREAHGSGT